MTSKVVWSRHDAMGVDVKDAVEVGRYVSFIGDYGYEVLRVTKLHSQKRTVKVVPRNGGWSREVLMDKIIAVYVKEEVST